MPQKQISNSIGFCFPRPHHYPCLCLKRGFFLLITYSLPLRRTILQSALLFFMDALTFIIQLFIWNKESPVNTKNLLIPENYPAPGQIVRTHFNPDLVTRRNPDIIHSHFPRDGGQYFMPVFQLYSEHRIGKGFYNSSILFNQGLFRHTIFGGAKISGYGVKKKKRLGNLPVGS